MLELLEIILGNSQQFFKFLNLGAQDDFLLMQALDGGGFSRESSILLANVCYSFSVL